MPRQKKPDPKRRNKPKAPDLRLVPYAGNIPKQPAGLDKPTRKFWDTYWSSDLAAVAQADIDLPAFGRLAEGYTQLNRLSRAILKSPIVKGSQGQPVMHPGYRIRSALEAEVRGLEDRFGCNPKARLALGIQLGQVHRQLDDLSGELTSDDDDEDEDPRLIDITPET